MFLKSMLDPPFASARARVADGAAGAARVGPAAGRRGHGRTTRGCPYARTHARTYFDAKHKHSHKALGAGMGIAMSLCLQAGVGLLTSLVVLNLSSTSLTTTGLLPLLHLPVLHRVDLSGCRDCRLGDLGPADDDDDDDDDEAAPDGRTLSGEERARVLQWVQQHVLLKNQDADFLCM